MNNKWAPCPRACPVVSVVEERNLWTLGMSTTQHYSTTVKVPLPVTGLQKDRDCGTRGSMEGLSSIGRFS